MSKFSRRNFIATAGAGAGGLTAALALPARRAHAAGATSSASSASSESPAALTRKFYTVLSLSRIGFSAPFEQSVALAHQYGFQAVDPDEKLFAQLSGDGLKKLLDDLAAKNLKFGAAGLPVDFRKDEATFSSDLKKLPDAAEVLRRAGVSRVSTYVLSCSNTLTYLQNFRQHACRLRECAKILADHGQLMGLEYVATRTVWRSESQPFIHTMSEMKELEVAIGTNNLGIQLDSWHWYNAQETGADIETLRNRQVITVDLNDAPRLPLDEQHDNRRELPAATGVIPVKVFLQSLAEIGYDGPIQAEPFNAQLRAMPLDQAVAATAAAIHKAFGEAGLA